MELFKGTLIDLLPPAVPPRRAAVRINPPRTRQPLMGEAKPESGEKPYARLVALPKRLRRPGCNCGTCRGCQENARWDKIFNEKFADPTYYERREPGFASPLSRAS